MRKAGIKEGEALSDTGRMYPKRCMCVYLYVCVYVCVRACVCADMGEYD